MIALAGNPNVGKSTLFNRLTGLRVHTGNWAGKTVSVARAPLKSRSFRAELVDLPGIYDLSGQGDEEEVARDFLAFGAYDQILAVGDANDPVPSLSLALSLAERTDRVILVLNFIDEADPVPDANLITSLSGIPTAAVSARKGRGIPELLALLESDPRAKPRFTLPREIEARVSSLLPLLPSSSLPARYLALRVLENDGPFLRALSEKTGTDLSSPDLALAAGTGEAPMGSAFREELARARFAFAGKVMEHASSAPPPARGKHWLDRLLCGKYTAYPLMAAALFLLIFLTAVASNYPSALLEQAFQAAESGLTALLSPLSFPEELLINGVLRLSGKVIAVMLPPMAIFFSLFTLLEDSGYLARIAFNLDALFFRAGSCGKQGLTMCMGLGCNVVGVSGCRIIASPRERAASLVTNSMIPCNGRFPALLAVSGAFFAFGSGNGAFFTGILLLFAAAVALISTRLLTLCVFRGLPSHFLLPLPRFRKPEILKSLWRTMTEKVFSSLFRAVTVAAPAGAILFLLLRFPAEGPSLYARFTAFLDPAGRFFGMDGVILAAFLFGFPAGETVLPLVLLGYMGTSALPEAGGGLFALLSAHGWTRATALSFLVFTMFHFPCAPTLLALWRETKSPKLLLLSVAVPLAAGLSLSFLAARLPL